MSRSIARIASVLALAVAAAVFAATALADNGNGNSATAPGQVKPAGEPAQPQAAAPPAAPVAQSGTAPGIKPSNTTDKHATCTTGGGTGTSATCMSSNPKTTKADASKRYGNGTTAAQIANSHGAPAGTVLTGPGNSQPHKVAVCPGQANKSGGRDVHALKTYTCPPPTSPAVAAAVSVPPPAQVLSSNTSSQSASESTQSASPASQSNAASVQSVASPARLQTPGAESGVLGAVKALSSPKPFRANAGVLGKTSPLHANAGVLGTIARIAGGNLPFSGFPLWTALVAALALLTAGAFLRRRSA